MIDIRGLTKEELREALAIYGQKPYRAGQVFTWLHKRYVSSFDDMTDISKDLRNRLKEDYYIYRLREADVQTSHKDGTKKFLFELQDGNLIESVFMKYRSWNTVCISSQVGCDMGCRFCASTVGGCVRGMTAGEMLDEVYTIEEKTKERVSGVVVMGSGEPLLVYNELIRFIKIITDESGKNISARNITVSTCGLVPQIKRLAEEKLQINLAISLHAPDDEKRKKIMPVAKKYPLDELIDACRYYFEKTGRRVTFEYSLISGINDGKEDAAKLSRLIKGLNCHVNLIPVNPVRENGFKPPDRRFAQAFKNALENFGINVTIRRELGGDIDGACGQLRRKHV
ncbi:MAG: 23S rRNA (adenine(2503)-C(2))-methyltransferase RlmN [Lachnospiraceae bacterium]|nr:23S rRNA (adenine(2503)-C(2))-methyltransferase RlmN [Lachnospiraceae bacterium]